MKVIYFDQAIQCKYANFFKPVLEFLVVHRIYMFIDSTAWLIRKGIIPRVIGKLR